MDNLEIAYITGSEQRLIEKSEWYYFSCYSNCGIETSGDCGSPLECEGLNIGNRLYLKPNMRIMFGRKKGDIILPNDESISRLHGSICVKPKDVIQVCQPTSMCKVYDMGSKYGTYILSGKQPIKVSEHGYDLKDQDKIRFGLQQHIFIVVYMPIITVVSTLSNKDKHNIEKLMDEIDGVISADWTFNCTHLTVSKATLTEKVILAMASAVPIVHMDYWTQVKYAIDNGDTLPNVQYFIPEISESLINKQNVSLSSNMKRRTLLKDFIFVYFNASQYKIYGNMVKLAGGKSLLYANTHLTSKELCAPNVVVVKYPDSDMTWSTLNIPPEYDSISDALLENKRKMISESEIPLAILHCSVEKYCNPKYNFAKLLKRMESTCQLLKVLVPDTQDETPDVKILPRVISDVQVNSSLNIKSVRQKHVIVPETYQEDTMELVDEEKFTCNDAFETKKAKESEKKAKKVDYVPETNTSAFSVETKSIVRGIENLENQQSGKVNEIEILKKLVVTMKETPLNSVIDLSANVNSDLKNADNNQNLNCDVTQNELDNSCQINNFLTSTPLRQTICSQTKDNFETAKEDNKHCGIMSQKMLENHTARKRKRSSEHVSDAECDKEAATCSASLKRQRSYNYFGQENSAFFRLSVNHKKFKKVYNKVPETRLKMSDMYVWDGCDIKYV